MPKPRFRSFIAATVGSVLLSTVGVQAQATPGTIPGYGIGEVRVIATATLPPDTGKASLAAPPDDPLVVDATLVGGLSGIDYDPETDTWVVISDDPSLNSPARYYNLDLAYDAESITNLELTSAVTLLQANGDPYPTTTVGGNVPDLESIRFDPQGDSLWYTSEGSYELDLDPFVAETDVQGQLTGSTVPEIFTMSGGGELGPRENLVFEGLSFSADGASLWVAMEGPLYQDGEPSTVGSTSFSRITRIDREGNTIQQVAYEIDALPEEPSGAATAGITEILAISGKEFLVLERASIETLAAAKYFIRIYEVSVIGATDVGRIEALDDATFTPAVKRLVLDLNATDIEPIDNIEGITWGPDFENGNRSLVLVSDNNFSETQVTQVIVLEVEP